MWHLLFLTYLLLKCVLLHIIVQYCLSVSNRNAQLKLNIKNENSNNKTKLLPEKTRRDSTPRAAAALRRGGAQSNTHTQTYTHVGRADASLPP